MKILNASAMVVVVGVLLGLVAGIFQNTRTADRPFVFAVDGSLAEFRIPITFTNGYTNCEAIVVVHLTRAGMKPLKLEPPRGKQVN